MITRRTFLQAAAATATLPFLPRSGFKIGIQTYSLRAFDLDGAIRRVKELDLRYAQFYPGHQMSVGGDAAAYRKKLSDAGITMLSFGVCGFSKDHAANRKIFEFAKAMECPVLTADPAPDSFDSLESLTKDTGIKIAIHNHGPGHRYGKLADVEKALEKRSDALGVCVDTGHVIRSGEDPVKWIRSLRVHDVHLKDASGPDTFTKFGEGKLDIPGVLKALGGFDGLLAIEYELNEKDPMDDLRHGLELVREAMK